jgi:hypothetical protein
MPYSTDLGVVDLDHASVGNERRIRECLVGRADEGYPESGSIGCLHPLVGRELLEGGL